MSNKSNINAINVNTRNFNYHTLSRDGVRGGMEWVTMPQRKWGFNGSNNPVGSFGGGFNIKGSNFGTLYVEPYNSNQLDSCGNFLVFVDNSGIGYSIAGGGGIGYWTTAIPGSGESIGSGGYIRPMKDISAIIAYDHNISPSNTITAQKDFWETLQYVDSSNQPVHLDDAALIVMDKMQFLEASGNSAGDGGLGTIRYTYRKPNTTDLDPSGSSFQGLVYGPNHSSHWVKFGEGQQTAITYWRNVLLHTSGEYKVTTTGISPATITLELQGADASANYSVAIGLNSKTRPDASGSVAIGIGNTTSAPGAVALGYDCSAGGIASFADGSGCIAAGDYSVAMGHNNVIDAESGSSANAAFAIGENNNICTGYNATADGAVAMGTHNWIGGGNFVSDASHVSVIGAFAEGSGNQICRTGGGGERDISANYAIAMGEGNRIGFVTTTDSAYADYSVALGYHNRIASGGPEAGVDSGGWAICAFAEGSGNIISQGGASILPPTRTADYAIAMGEGNLISVDAFAPYGFAVGKNNIVDASFGVAIGEGNKTSGSYGVAMGYDCSAGGICSFADGSNCIVAGDYSVAMGHNNVIDAESGSSANAAFAIGENNNICTGYNATADGAVAMGTHNWIGGGNFVSDASHVSVIGAFAEGSGNQICRTGGGGERDISANYAIAMGEGNRIGFVTTTDSAYADYSVALGYHNRIASGGPEAGVDSGGWAICAFAEGSGNIISQGGASILPPTRTADYAIAMGEGNLISVDAFAPYGFAVGKNNIVDASFGVAIGEGNKTSGSYGVAMGYDCSAGGICSFADGSGCIAAGDYSVALGYNADTSSNYQFVVGISNNVAASGMATAGGNTFFIDNSQNVAMCVGGDLSFDVSRCRADVPVLDISGDLRVRGNCNINLRLIVTDISATRIFTRDLSATDISAIHINVTDISATNLDVSGRAVIFDLSATNLDVSGRAVIFDLSATNLDVSGRAVIIDLSATNLDVSGRAVIFDLSATNLDVSGRAFIADLSATKIHTVDLSATRIFTIDLSATNLDVSGRLFVGGQLDMSCNSIVDVSGIYFCEGTFIGEGNSFDISCVETLKMIVPDTSAVEIIVGETTEMQIDASHISISGGSLDTPALNFGLISQTHTSTGLWFDPQIPNVLNCGPGPSISNASVGQKMIWGASNTVNTQGNLINIAGQLSTTSDGTTGDIWAQGLAGSGLAAGAIKSGNPGSKVGGGLIRASATTGADWEDGYMGNSSSLTFLGSEFSQMDVLTRGVIITAWGVGASDPNHPYFGGAMSAAVAGSAGAHISAMKLIPKGFDVGGEFHICVNDKTPWTGGAPTWVNWLGGTPATVEIFSQDVTTIAAAATSLTGPLALNTPPWTPSSGVWSNSVPAAPPVSLGDGKKAIIVQIFVPSGFHITIGDCLVSVAIDMVRA